MDGPADDKVINWLIYLIVALCGVVFSMVQKHFGGRLAKVEETIDEHNSKWDAQLEARRLEIKEDFRLLHQKVDKGNQEILRELRKKNGGA